PYTISMHRTLLDRSCDEAKSTVSVRVTKQCSLRILPKNQILGIFDSYFRIIKYWFNNNHKYILIGHSAHLSKNLIKYPKWLNIIIEIYKSTYFNP
ncbi:hypothetical protein, partial [Acinetobacter baumannii]|uniref:hypothetical protein n=5 Tax=Acinetobacter calcoaceticus/baumannii complex TaxID=909768 RepID=UPI001D16FF8F